MFLKSVLFGIGGALLATALWIAGAFILPILLPYLIARVRGTSGGSFASIGSGSILIVALLGFAFAFIWAWLRLRIP
jgi:hypothetical protein